MPGCARASDEVGRASGGLGDLQGPKIRLGGSPTARCSWCPVRSSPSHPRGAGHRGVGVPPPTLGCPVMSRWGPGSWGYDDGRCHLSRCWTWPPGRAHPGERRRSVHARADGTRPRVEARRIRSPTETSPGNPRWVVDTNAAVPAPRGCDGELRSGHQLHGPSRTDPSRIFGPCRSTRHRRPDPPRRRPRARRA